MASIKDLRKRIASVKNTQQTTRAMKMVSAAKLRRAQDAITNNRPYARRIGELIRLVSAMPDNPVTSQLIRRERADGGAKKNVLVLVVSSDRGLCGGFNSNVIKATARWVAANQANYGTIELAFVGRKAYGFFKTKKYKIGTYFEEIGGKVTYQKANKLSEALVEAYLSGRVDEVKVVYNEFKNAITQKTQVEGFLPLLGDGVNEGAPAGGKAAADEVPPSFLVKPSPAEVLERLLNKNFAIQAFRILLESQASEHGARMSSMESATKNAGAMIRKLTLSYNKQRQANITKELLEIISGSESQKAG